MARIAAIASFSAHLLWYVGFDRRVGPMPGRQGSTRLPIVTDVARKVLHEGGNVVDTTITAVFIIARQ